MIKLNIGLLLSSALLTGCALIGKQDDKYDRFFAEAPKSDEALPADKIYPQGRLFPFSGYSPYSKNISEFKKYGIELAGPVYGNREGFLKDCVKNKVNMIFPLFPMYRGERITKEKLSNPKFEINWDELMADIEKTVKDNMDNNLIAWWYITPEEIRFWRKRELEYLKKAVETIHKADIYKRPVWGYAPNHRNAGALAKTEALYMDVVGKGFFCNYSKYQNNRIWVRWSAEQEIKSIELAGRTGKVIPVMCPEMFIQPPADKLNMIPLWVRHDVYLGLVCGMKGVVVFSFAKRKNFNSHAMYFNAYMKVAEELCGKENLGHFFLFGEKRDDIKMEIESGPATLTCKPAKETFSYPSVAFLGSVYGKERRLFAVNSANEKVTVVFSGFPEGKTEIINIFSGEKLIPENGALKVVFDPLEVKVFSIKGTE